MWSAAGLVSRDPDAHRPRPPVRPRIVGDGRERCTPARRGSAARYRPVQAILPRRRVDRPAGGANDRHALEATRRPRRFEWRCGVDLEVLDLRVRMIGLLDAVDERAALDGHRAPRRLDPRMRLDEPRLHGEVELDHVAALPGALDAQIA